MTASIVLFVSCVVLAAAVVGWSTRLSYRWGREDERRQWVRSALHGDSLTVGGSMYQVSRFIDDELDWLSDEALTSGGHSQ